MIISTRPADRQGNLLNRFPYEVVRSPMLDVRALPWSEEPLADADALIFTSQTAVELAIPHLRTRTMPVYAVGSATAELASNAGFETILCANGTAEHLLHVIDGADFRAGVYLSARHVSRDLAVARPGMIKRQVIYETQMAHDFSEPALDLITSGKFFTVPFYSPRTLEAFERLTRRDGLEKFLSNATAVLIHRRLQAKMTLSWGAVRIANDPTTDSIVTEIKAAA